MQLIHQHIGSLAAPEAEVDERNVRGVLRDQTFGRSGGRHRPSYIRPASLELTLHCSAEMPAIFNNEDTHSAQIRRRGLQRAMDAGQGHRSRERLPASLCLQGQSVALLGHLRNPS